MDRRACAYLSPCLADAFLAGAWHAAALAARAGQVLEPRPPWIELLVRDVLAAYHRRPADRPRELAGYIALRLERLDAATAGPAPRVRRWLVAELAMVRRPWPVPELASVGAVASHLEVSDRHLAWLADVRGLERTVAEEKLRHYRYRWLPRHGGPPRVIERPKARLKSIQRRVLHEVLDWIPAHDAAHGFTRGRSARSNAAAHTRRPVVTALDLEDFFASVSAPRVYGIFRTAGYPEPVAHTLTALTTNAVPIEEWAAVPRPTTPTLSHAHHRLGRRLAAPHLPQGAPTSPALANLAAFTLDRRLTGLAAALGATYTRYADDLTFSGSSRLLDRGERIRDIIATIAREEGFAVNTRKSVVTPRAGRQQVCGIVVNERLNVARREYDELKAIIHNAARRGPSGENRAGVSDFRAHLLGRIAWIESLHPARGAKLHREFTRIDWDHDRAA
ncbi:MAG: reverse transcriptase family protein [Solirubrobacteraceae bacterium MAG38_C4-C5]|nr:reverse transcriptase family protein [Candidatus Siliceabacter maunaloa]